MLLAGLLLLAWDWNRLRVVVNLPAGPEATSPLFESRRWEAVGAVLFVFTAGYRALTDRYNLLLWLGICVLVGAVGCWGRGGGNTSRAGVGWRMPGS